MNALLNSLLTKDTYTENGALTNSTSLNNCLDFFFVAGNRNDHIESFHKAFAEDPQLAMRILFWSRDCRGGAGTRKTFISVMKWLQKYNTSTFSKVFKFIPEYGYWKDIFKLDPSKELIAFVAETLLSENDHSLCAKYCPRKGAWFYHLKKVLGMSPKQFRKLIVSKTQVVETQMCENKWNEIDYETVPSVASLRYTNAFRNHDPLRYENYVQDVFEGKKKINAAVLYPHDIYRKWKSTADKTIMAMWDNLPNYMAESKILPICDTSGSMYGFPLDVSVALGCYISERNTGPFKDAFITFSSCPQLNILYGNICERFKQLSCSDWGMSTNLQAVFDLVLDRAMRNNVSENDMPDKLLIISDMEFDSSGAHETNLEMIRQKYEKAGYKMPGIIFWNVDGLAGNVPATMYDQDVALVSGYSPSILTSILKAECLSPVALMEITVNSRRYSQIII